MSADSSKAAIHAVLPTAEMREAATAASDSIGIGGSPSDRIAAYQVAARKFALSYGQLVSEQLTAVVKLQILLAATAALMFSQSDGEKCTLEQFVEFLTGHSADSLFELTNALMVYMQSLGARTQELVLTGLDTTDLKPN